MKIISFVFSILFFIPSSMHALSIQDKIETFAIKNAEQRFGSISLNPAQENKIREIAAEMNITNPFLIRKMNHNAIASFGYHNAFVYFSQFLNVIPLTNTAILFISEGFFEDLSCEEQRFLIGHELTHIKEHHAQYINLTVYSLLFLTSTLGYCLRKQFIPLITAKFFPTNELFSKITYGSLVYMSCMIPILGSYVYRRRIEHIADHEALIKLKEFDGAIKLINRWKEECKLPADNPCYGIFSDHPSCRDRIAHALHLKNKHKE